MDEVEQVLVKGGVHRIMLDNFSSSLIKEAVQLMTEDLRQRHQEELHWIPYVNMQQQALIIFHQEHLRIQ